MEVYNSGEAYNVGGQYDDAYNREGIYYAPQTVQAHYSLQHGEPYIQTEGQEVAKADVCKGQNILASPVSPAPSGQVDYFPAGSTMFTPLSPDIRISPQPQSNVPYFNMDYALEAAEWIPDIARSQASYICLQHKGANGETAAGKELSNSEPNIQGAGEPKTDGSRKSKRKNKHRKEVLQSSEAVNITVTAPETNELTKSEEASKPELGDPSSDNVLAATDTQHGVAAHNNKAELAGIGCS